MIPNTGLPVAHIRGKPVPAVGAEGVVEPQRLRHIRDAVARDRPVGNVVVDLLRLHVVDVLGVVGAVFRLRGAYELIGLENDVADAALAHPGVFAAPGVDPVHHHAGHRLHSRVALSARLALDQPRQQLPVGISHRHHPLRSDCVQSCRWYPMPHGRKGCREYKGTPAGLKPAGGAVYCSASFFKRAFLASTPDSAVSYSQFQGSVRQTLSA